MERAFKDWVSNCIWSLIPTFYLPSLPEQKFGEFLLVDLDVASTVPDIISLI